MEEMETELQFDAATIGMKNRQEVRQDWFNVFGTNLHFIAL